MKTKGGRHTRRGMLSPLLLPPRRRHGECRGGGRGEVGCQCRGRSVLGRGGGGGGVGKMAAGVAAAEGGGSQSRKKELGDVGRPCSVGFHARKNPLQRIDKTGITPLIPIPHPLAAPIILLPNTSPHTLSLFRRLVPPIDLEEPRLAQRTRILLIRPRFDTRKAERVRASVDPCEFVVGGLLEADAARDGRPFLLLKFLFFHEFLLKKPVGRLGDDGGRLLSPLRRRFGVGFGRILPGLRGGCRAVVVGVAPSPHAVGGERRGDAFQSPNGGLASGPAGWDDGCGGGRWGRGCCGFGDTSHP
mmetsp:Transcript_35736/g.64356  ORF Transcript_35736/g.64356 Transcript_35736/m.64356 type:complete len:302 (+) Transcript_35736:1106-2011(+)